MIDRCLFTPNGDNPPFPVPLDEICTVPTEQMAALLADLVLGDSARDVLEIGTGSGFQAAIIAQRCRSLVSVDITLRAGVVEKLPDHVALIVANGYEFDSGEQFDGVLVTFAASRLSSSWIKQTKVGGRLVVPIQMPTGCRISVFERTEIGIKLIDVAAYAPFTPGAEA
jgi:protein-L-isoaspartate(D-aspartate) O-methyltransferase